MKHMASIKWSQWPRRNNVICTSYLNSVVTTCLLGHPISGINDKSITYDVADSDRGKLM